MYVYISDTSISKITTESLLLSFSETLRVYNFVCDCIAYDQCVTKPNLGLFTADADLLTLGCGEGKYSIYLQGTKQRVWVAHVQKTQTP